MNASRRVPIRFASPSDLVIAMSTDHQTFLLDTCQYHVPLFNEVRHGRSEPLLDVWEAVSAWETTSMRLDTTPSRRWSTSRPLRRVCYSISGRI
jgi:hypothetical protein